MVTKRIVVCLICNFELLRIVPVNARATVIIVFTVFNFLHCHINLSLFTLIFVDTDEDLLKRSHGDSVTENVVILHPQVKFFKESLEPSCLVVVNLE